LRLAVVELRTDVITQQIKGVEALPGTDPTRPTRHLELIKEQMALREARRDLKKSATGIM
jgi:hypothetical protein